MTDHIMTLIDELRKAGLHEDLEFCKNAAEYLAQQAIELEARIPKVDDIENARILCSRIKLIIWRIGT